MILIMTLFTHYKTETLNFFWAIVMVTALLVNLHGMVEQMMTLQKLSKLVMRMLIKAT